MKSKQDKYDKAIERLVKRPGDLVAMWASGENGRPGWLFQFCTPNGKGQRRPDGKLCGCLTHIRSRKLAACVAWTGSLTREIRVDKRIATNIYSFSAKFRRMTHEERRATLFPYGDWQRHMDKEIRSPA